jgi:hypothetical protein
MITTFSAYHPFRDIISPIKSTSAFKLDLKPVCPLVLQQLRET